MVPYDAEPENDSVPFDPLLVTARLFRLLTSPTECALFPTRRSSDLLIVSPTSPVGSVALNPVTATATFSDVLTASGVDTTGVSSTPATVIDAVCDATDPGVVCPSSVIVAENVSVAEPSNSPGL